MKLFKNQWLNIILIVIILALLIPQIRKPLQIFANKAFAFSPSVTDEEDREQIASYDWVLEKNNKERVDFSEYKDEVIIVNYWATWCPPCIAEMPSFQQLYDDYGDKVAFFFISGEDHETTTNFLKRKRYSFPSYRMLTTDPKPLDGFTLPTTYLIDKEGNIIIKKVGAADWNSASMRNTLDELLKS
ncbi:TlpA disulfide reductase family protein [Salegentibacter sp. F188]|uniref:TlpA disulfide reductase family protein n=1 Tax=Autumnicola patrickiae TaxID=3075591 RepID=A0ABU3E6D1_9FLAO|nr:TlpA disulfide reductase family protein [Salegentibacter sp. F188]MDT0691550.1 TlpA disulfide reductase family protein [Salegentibacter sp. F188]